MPYLEAQRIGLVKLGAIGDVVNTLPLANRLRAGYPQARITWIIGPGPARLLAGHACVDEFYVLDVRQRSSLWRAWRELRARRFDLVLDLQRLIKSGLIAWASGAPQRLGFDTARSKESSWIFSNQRIAPNPHPGVTVAQYLEFADYLELPQCTPRFDLPFEEYEPAPAGTKRVVLNLGASWRSKLWFEERWAQLATRLTQELGAQVCLCGGPEDASSAARVQALVKVPLINAVGQLSLRGTAGLLRSAHLVISGDTGPLHMAVALGTAVIGLYGAADPRRTAPFGQEHAVIRHPVPCSPCRKRECFVAGQPCMSGIEVENVFQAARARLIALAT